MERQRQVIQIDMLRVQRLRNGDPVAFRYIYDLYSKDLFGFLFKLLRSNEDAEEVLQDTFVKIWENRHNLDTSKQIRAYIFTIALNFARMNLRTRKYQFNLLDYLKNAATETSTCQQETDEFKILYDKAVDNLPPERKKIYIMCRHENLSHKEIASLLNISTKTVENQMTKAIQTLQSFLSQYKDIAILVAIYIPLIYPGE